MKWLRQMLCRHFLLPFLRPRVWLDADQSWVSVDYNGAKVGMSGGPVHGGWEVSTHTIGIYAFDAAGTKTLLKPEDREAVLKLLSDRMEAAGWRLRCINQVEAEAKDAQFKDELVRRRAAAGVGPIEFLSLDEIKKRFSTKEEARNEDTKHDSSKPMHRR